jgi:negative regulator of sigma E activity
LRAQQDEQILIESRFDTLIAQDLERMAAVYDFLPMENNRIIRMGAEVFDLECFHLWMYS